MANSWEEHICNIINDHIDQSIQDFPQVELFRVSVIKRGDCCLVSAPKGLDATVARSMDIMSYDRNAVDVACKNCAVAMILAMGK